VKVVVDVLDQAGLRLPQVGTIAARVYMKSLSIKVVR
jgi:hypothetical protein